jgi:hypothetical protein
MRSLLDQASGERMELPDFRADFERHFRDSGSAGFWKLERQQVFQEPGYDTWEAFVRGEWAESLRLLEAGRADLAAEHRRIAEHGVAVHRVRVVEEPLTAYLQWELHVLRLREQCGSGVRIVRADEVAPLETGGPLPEVFTVGRAVMYEAIYDDRGVLAAARRFADRELIWRCRGIIAGLYAKGEPLADYFTREVAPLPPPLAGQRSM